MDGVIKLKTVDIPKPRTLEEAYRKAGDLGHTREASRNQRYPLAIAFLERVAGLEDWRMDPEAWLTKDPDSQANREYFMKKVFEDAEILARQGREA